MKTYIITIPAFSLNIRERSKKEALEQFWFDYDTAQEDSEWGKPTITTATK